MKSIAQLSLLPPLALLLTSCAAPIATPYQPIKNNEGYVDRKISDNEYEIQVRGNNVTTYPTLLNHFNKRANELCGPGGFTSTVSESRYSQITDAVAGRNYYRPTQQGSLPYLSGIVRCNR